MNCCRFCNIVKKNDVSLIYDTVLYKTDNFLVIPALGSLVPGYVMIISCKHIHSMAYLSNIELDELTSLITYIKKYITYKFNVTPILFEHGSAVGCFEKSANSVDHAHLHIVPIKLNKEAKIIQSSDLFKISNLKTIKAYKDNPYLLYINNKNTFYLSQKESLPSQYMRMWIAEEVGIPLKWDWKKFEFIENINKTIDIFKM